VALVRKACPSGYARAPVQPRDLRPWAGEDEAGLRPGPRSAALFAFTQVLSTVKVKLTLTLGYRVKLSVIPITLDVREP
jgi:hypothetical protein